MIPTMKPWDLAAADLVTRVAGLAIDADEAPVSARAIAAATLRETLAHREERLRRPRRAADVPIDLDPLKHEVAFLKAAIEVIDPGGACTQEYEDDLRIEAEKRDLTERDT